MTTKVRKEVKTLRKIVSDLLLVIGFEPNGTAFVRYKHPFVQIIDVQGSAHGGRAYLRSYLLFSANLDASSYKFSRNKIDVVLSLNRDFEEGSPAALRMDGEMVEKEAWLESIAVDVRNLALDIDRFSSIDEIAKEHFKGEGQNSRARAFGKFVKDHLS